MKKVRDHTSFTGAILLTFLKQARQIRREQRKEDEVECMDWRNFGHGPFDMALGSPTLDRLTATSAKPSEREYHTPPLPTNPFIAS